MSCHRHVHLSSSQLCVIVIPRLCSACGLLTWERMRPKGHIQARIRRSRLEFPLIELLEFVCPLPSSTRRITSPVSFVCFCFFAVCYYCLPDSRTVNALGDEEVLHLSSVAVIRGSIRPRKKCRALWGPCCKELDLHIVSLHPFLSWSQQRKHILVAHHMASPSNTK